MIEDMDNPTNIQTSVPCCGTCKCNNITEDTCETCGWTTDMEKANGLYCHRCGEKTYLSDDGSHRRCPNCDDRPHEIAPHYSNKSDGWTNKWVVTYCSE